ncbi:MAG TPA: VWA domain-containing protein [Terriglobia bacterium]|nr:VWA domain-containing protein [Terriglobia bacterium]
MRRAWIAPLLLVCAAAGGAQTSAPPANPEAPKPNAVAPQSTQNIRVQVNLVNVLFTVTDKKGRNVPNLGKDDFRVLEGGQPQTISFFSKETDLPLRIGVLIDTSNSVSERLHFEEEAAVDFLSEAIRPGKDMAFVVGFDVEPQLVQDYTDDVEKLSNAIRGLAAGGTTSLYDALYYACQQKMLNLSDNNANSGSYLRRVLIVVSDGKDTNSAHSRDEALEMAERSEAIIYAISTNNSGTNTGGSGEPNGYSSGDKILKYLAGETGGRTFFPFEASDLESNFRQIAAELRSQYSLAYTPINNKRDGTFRRISVETTEKGLRVRAKAGYFAPSK